MAQFIRSTQSDVEIEQKDNCCIHKFNSASGLSSKELRKRINSIQNDNNLSASEKAKQIQNLMTFSWRTKQESNKKRLSRSNSDTFSVESSHEDGSDDDDEEEILRIQQELKINYRPLSPKKAKKIRSFHDQSNNIYGCKHYMRNCLIKASCCSKFFPCRFCHDEYYKEIGDSHKIDRYAINQVKCMNCGNEQEVSESCNNCNISFAKYFCKSCKFYDNHPDKSIYHCEHCNICRIGQGLGIDYFHCHKCNACMSITLRNHKCVERALESDCPICHEFMFTSTSPVMFLPCGHCIHVSCYEKYTTTNYVCPVCSKSLGNMESYFRRIDEVLKHEKMPVEFEGVKTKIFCADCEKRSIAKFHFLYHKCFHCKSYNTKVLEQIQKGVVHPLELEQIAQSQEMQIDDDDKMDLS